jgi:uncharacterized membrane protein YjjP (DUF1212 family)
MSENMKINDVEEEIRQVEKNYRSVRNWVVGGIAFACMGVLLILFPLGAPNGLFSSLAIIFLSIVIIGYGATKMRQFAKEKEVLLLSMNKIAFSVKCPHCKKQLPEGHFEYCPSCENKL